MHELPGDMTRLLAAWSHGDDAAGDELARAVLPYLRQLAGNELRREQHLYFHGQPQTLAPTELINEAFVKLQQQGRIEWQSRRQFFAVAALLMRRVLTDHARKRLTEKRGQEFTLLSLDDEAGPVEIVYERAAELVALDDALNSFHRIDSQKVRIVELRFYGGWTYDEIAAFLQTTPEAIRNQWRFAKVWLLREIIGVDPRNGSPS